MLPPKNDTDPFGIRAFDGVPMAEEFSFEFTVDASQNPDEPNRAIDFCTAEIVCAVPDAGTRHPRSKTAWQRLFRGSCGTESSCHLRREPTKRCRTTPGGDSVIFKESPDKGGVTAAMHRIVAAASCRPRDRGGS